MGQRWQTTRAELGGTAVQCVCMNDLEKLAAENVPGEVLFDL